MKGEGDNEQLTIMHDLFINNNNNDNSIKERENASHQHLYISIELEIPMKTKNPIPPGRNATHQEST